MDYSNSLITPMIMRSFEIHFDLKKKDEELLGDETPYLSAIRALMHFANNT